MENGINMYKFPQKHGFIIKSKFQKIDITSILFAPIMNMVAIAPHQLILCGMKDMLYIFICIYMLGLYLFKNIEL